MQHDQSIGRLEHALAKGFTNRLALVPIGARAAILIGDQLRFVPTALRIKLVHGALEIRDELAAPTFGDRLRQDQILAPESLLHEEAGRAVPQKPDPPPSQVIEARGGCARRAANTKLPTAAEFEVGNGELLPLGPLGVTREVERFALELEIRQVALDIPARHLTPDFRRDNRLIMEPARHTFLVVAYRVTQTSWSGARVTTVRAVAHHGRVVGQYREFRRNGLFTLLHDVIEQGQLPVRRADGLFACIQVGQRVDPDFVPLMSVAVDAHAALMLAEVQAIEANRQRLRPHILAAHIDAQPDLSRRSHQRADPKTLIAPDPAIGLGGGLLEERHTGGGLPQALVVSQGRLQQELDHAQADGVVFRIASKKIQLRPARGLFEVDLRPDQ